jgi:hypothetical protein
MLRNLLFDMRNILTTLKNGLIKNYIKGDGLGVKLREELEFLLP